jgi:lipopolysaccharide export system permease protein
MRIFDRYIARGILRSSALVLVILVALFSFGMLARELDDVGEERYRLIDALVFVGLSAPQRAVELIPVSALLGTIIALGGMAAARELQAMRGVGVSVARIAGSALRAGIPMMLLVAVGAELLAPALEQQGRARRQAALSRTPALVGGKGFWFRDGPHITRVGRVLHGRDPYGVEIFEFDQQGVLTSFTRATSAELLDDDTWMLADVDRQEITGQGSTTRHFDRLSWKTTLSATEMGLILQRPESLSPSDLIHQVRSRRERGQGFAEYSLVLWQKLSLPLLTAAMILLAVPFVFGPLRSASMGRRVMLGSILGIGSWLVARVAGYLGVLGEVQPPITALAPVVLIALLALYLLRRIP